MNLKYLSHNLNQNYTYSYNYRHKAVLFITVAILGLTISSCGLFLSSLLSSDNNHLELDLTNPNHVLRNLPESQINLPRSLQSGLNLNTNHSQSRSQIQSGTSVISPHPYLEQLPYAKSANYLSTLQRIAYGSVGQTFLKALRQIGETTTIPLDQVIYLDRVDLEIQGMQFFIEPGNSLISRLSQQGNRLEFYWYGVIANQSYSHIPGNTVAGYMYLSVNRAGHSIFQVDLPTWIITTEPEVVRTPLRFTEVFDPNTATLHSMNRYATHQDYSKIFREGNAYIIMDVWSGTNISLTYGDDSFGGMLTLTVDDLGPMDSDEIQDPDVQQGPEPINFSQIHFKHSLSEFDNLYLDYYDGSGNLVTQAWGTSTTQSGTTEDYFWLDQQLAERGSLNIGDPAYSSVFAANPKPEYILIKSTNHFFEEEQPLPQISLDHGATWQEIAIDLFQVGNFHYKTGDYWQPGDLAYFQTYSHSEQAPDNSSLTDYFGYSLSYRIPHSNTQDHHDFNLSYNIPLYALLPIDSNYQYLELKRSNPITYISWKSPWGQWHYGPESEVSSMDPGPSQHHPDFPPQEYQTYNYWLENTHHNSLGNFYPDDWDYNNPDTLDTHLGDKDLGTSTITIYYWHQGAERLVQVPAYYSSSLELPSYLQYNYSQSIHRINQTFNRLYTQFTTQVLPSNTMQIGDSFPETELFYH